MKIPPIISVDDHVIEPPHLFERWIDPKFRDEAPSVRRVHWEVGPGYHQLIRPSETGPETDCWFIGDNPQFVSSTVVAAGRSPDQIDAYLPAAFEEMKPAFYDPAARLVDMDVINVERSLCFPNAMRFAGQMFLWLAEVKPELALACVRAYNDWMVEEWCGDSGGRLIPLCTVPLWDAHLAADEIRRNAARGVHAVTFPELPAHLDLPSLYAPDGYWVPFIEACDETSTTICMHIGSASWFPTSSPDAPMSVIMASSNVNAQLSLTDWLMSGMLARHPRLKLAFSESQVGWMPYVLERLDRIWQTGNKVANLPPELTEPPSSYIPGRVFGCFFADDFGVQSRDAVGIDVLTFESDYPHQDSMWPNTMAYAEKALAGCTDAEIEKIVRRNAMRMLDLPESLPA